MRADNIPHPPWSLQRVLVVQRVCVMCEAITPCWVRWSNSREEAWYFCDSECLVRWVERGREDIAREIVLECRQIHEEGG